MSVIKTDLLQNRLGTSHPAVTKADFVKAWVHFDGLVATPVIKRGFNVTNITDRGNGTYTVNFAAAFVDIYYANSRSSNQFATNVGIAPTATAAGFNSATQAGGNADSTFSEMVTAGVLA